MTDNASVPPFMGGNARRESRPAPRETAREKKQRLAFEAKIRKSAKEAAADAERRKQAKLKKQREVPEASSETSSKPTELARHGLREERVLADNGSIATVPSRGFSLRGLGAEHVEAARRFSQCWETAYAGLHCRGFEPGVQGGEMHAAHLLRITAQQRLVALKAKLGRDDFALLQAVVLLNHGPAELHAAGIVADNRSAMTVIKNVLRKTFESLTGTRMAPDDRLKKLHALIREAELDPTV
jgi:hypothetical protein